MQQQNTSSTTATSDIHVMSPPFPPTIAAILGVLGGIISVTTVAGNVLVLLAFVVERSLRVPANYFVASLAVTDVLIGAISMNFFNLLLLLGRWPMGLLLCELWLAMDYTLSLSSQYTVFFITLDRYCSVKIPAAYRNWRTDRKVCIMVAVTWIIPFLLFFSTIMGWPYFIGRKRHETECYAEFTSNAIFNTILTLGYYWLTLVVMCILYAGIYQVALNLQRKSDAKRRQMDQVISNACYKTEQTTLHSASNTGKTLPHRTPRLLDNPSRPPGELVVQQAGSINTTSSHLVEDTEVEKNVTGARSRSSKTKKKVDRKHSGQQKGNKKDSFEGEENSSYSTRSDSFDGPIQKPLKGPKSSRKQSLAAVRKSTRATTLLNPHFELDNDTKTSHMTQLHGPSEAFVEQNPVATNLLNTELAASSVTLLSSAPEVFVGVRFIDQESLHSIPSEDNVRLLCDMFPQEKLRDWSVVASQPPPLLFSNDYSVNILSSAALPSSSSTSESATQNHARCFSNGGRGLFVTVTNSPGGGQAHTRIVTEASPDLTVQGSSKCHTPPQQKHRETMNLPKWVAYLRQVMHQIQRRGTRPTSSADRTQDSHNQQHSGQTSVSCQEPGVSLTMTTSFGGVNNMTTKPLVAPVEAPPPPPAAVTSRCRELGRRENRAKKALRTITFILGAFLFCWTPYHVLILIKGFCDTPDGYTCVNSHLYNISYWLCYLNSPINPFCYAFANAQFKRTFLRILRCDFHRT